MHRHRLRQGCVPVLGGGVFHSAALRGTCLQLLLQRHGGPRHTLHSSMNKSLPCCAWGRGIMPQDGEKNLQLQSVLNHLLCVKGSGASMALWPEIVYHANSFAWKWHSPTKKIISAFLLFFFLKAFYLYLFSLNKSTHVQ